jgi:hypothetical protein
LTAELVKGSTMLQANAEDDGLRGSQGSDAKDDALIWSLVGLTGGEMLRVSRASLEVGGGG